MRRLSSYTAALTLVFGLGVTANAGPIVIDNFASPNPPVSVQVGLFDPPASLSGLNSGSPSIFGGGTRTISGSTNLSTGEFAAIGGNINWGGGIGLRPGSFGVFTGAGAVETFLNYTFPSLNASQQTDLTLTFALIDGGGTNPNMDFTAEFISGLGNSSTVTVMLPNNNTGTSVSIPFSAFTNLDLTTLTGLNLRINDGGSPQTSSDFILTEVALTGVIPEPATLAIAGIFGIAGLVTARRKLKKNAEVTTAA